VGECEPHLRYVSFFDLAVGTFRLRVWLSLERKVLLMQNGLKDLALS
jgi:hypothetical protein